MRRTILMSNLVEHTSDIYQKNQAKIARQQNIIIQLQRLGRDAGVESNFLDSRFRIPIEEEEMARRCESSTTGALHHLTGPR